MEKLLKVESDLSLSFSIKHQLMYVPTYTINGVVLSYDNMIKLLEGLRLSKLEYFRLKDEILAKALLDAKVIYPFLDGYVAGENSERFIRLVQENESKDFKYT